MEYSIDLPGLVQHRNTQRILMLKEDKRLAVDAGGKAYPEGEHEPIPLTFWWLCVFGFELVRGQRMEEYRYDNGGRPFTVCRDDHGEWFCNDQHGMRNLRYVHELQEHFAAFNRLAMEARGGLAK